MMNARPTRVRLRSPPPTQRRENDIGIPASLYVTLDRLPKGRWIYPVQQRRDKNSELP